MATRLYKVPYGKDEFQITEAVGSATVSQAIELTVDLANTIIKDGNTVLGTRTLSKAEVLLALENLQNYIVKNQWPPA